MPFTIGSNQPRRRHRRTHRPLWLSRNDEIQLNGREWTNCRRMPRKLQSKWMNAWSVRLCYRIFWSWTNMRPHTHRLCAKWNRADERFYDTRIWSDTLPPHTANRNHLFVICAAWDSRFPLIYRHTQRYIIPEKFKWKIINENWWLRVKVPHLNIWKCLYYFVPTKDWKYFATLPYFMNKVRLREKYLQIESKFFIQAKFTWIVLSHDCLHL